ncbi:MAG: COP23 domain-containing protein [Cyanobacteria bacterium P01_G01_bin.38]
MVSKTQSHPIYSMVWRASTVLLSGAFLGGALLMLPLASQAQTADDGTVTPPEESTPPEEPGPATPESDNPDATADTDSAGSPDAADPLADNARFECQINEGRFTVMYLPESQPGQAYPWAVPGDMGGGWSAERRCYEISDRLERYRPEGLSELSTGIENGYDIVCARTDQNPGLCQIILTVPSGQDSLVTRDRVFENLTLADGGVSTTGVNTFAASDNNLLGQIGEALGGLSGDDLGSALGFSNSDINLKPYLDASDGGTGEYLQGRSVTPGRQLNPENFR